MNKTAGCLIALFIFILGGLAGALVHNQLKPYGEVRVRVDTVKVEVPKPVRVEVVRKEVVRIKDTVKISDKKPEYINTPDKVESAENDAPALSDSGLLEIPITRNIYQTENYKATVEGWRPQLVEMEIYKKTIIKKPKFSISVGPGISYDGKNIKPTVNITAGYVLFSR